MVFGQQSASNLLDKHNANLTKLHFLALKGNVAELDRLLSSDPEARKQIDVLTGSSRKTALQLAVGRGYAETVDVLMRHGASARVKSLPGDNSQLHEAVNRRDAATICVMMKHDPGLADIKNGNGLTAAQLAAQLGNIALVASINQANSKSASHIAPVCTEHHDFGQENDPFDPMRMSPRLEVF